MRPDDNSSSEGDQSRAHAAVRPMQENGQEWLEQLRALLGTQFQVAAAAFRSDTAVRLAALREAGKRTDLKQMARLTHALSGSCASMGATQLAALCQELELRCKNARPDDWMQCLDRIATESAHFEACLNALLPQDALLLQGAVKPPRTC